MIRSGLGLIVLMGLLSGTAVLAAETTPAAATTAMPAKSAIPSASSTVMPAAAQPAAASAGNIEMPATTGSETQLPSRGMNMANVEHIYGTPLEKLAPVPAKGTPQHPPITRWVYPDFVVYFEYDHVVHAVTKAHPFKDSDHHNG